MAATADRRPRGPRPRHGTTSRWRTGCPCPKCTRSHTVESQRARKRASETLWAAIGPGLIAALSSGATYQQALTDAGISSRTLNARRRRDPRFARRVDRGA